ncbi:hypothetical protein CFK39_10540 [Brachybacterium avium]|uniref:Uncharacterized protein n=1 Tax=Brachybacterium avium TaxID=2017485 RepID=A0A220UDG8_9MICO|nr:hypothetical protein [Brachybacterium avium]ASK66177.1 hypothetical protein CFK39_10540 [Brachybacterium avium]
MLPLLLAAVLSALLLYVAAVILLDVPISSVLTVIGLAAALLLWRLPRGGLLIADAVVLSLVGLVLYLAGLDLITFCLAGIVGALALRRYTRGWLYLATGAVALASGSSSITMALNEGLVPRLFTEAVPWINLHLPVLVLGLVMTGIALVFLAVGTWKLALHLDVLALALLVAAAAHLAAGVLGFVSMNLPMMLAELFPNVYSFDEDSLAMTSSMIAMLQMNSKAVLMGALIPLAAVVAAIVRLARQPRISLRGAPLEPTSMLVAGLTAVTLAVPGLLLLVLSRIGDDNPGQIILPFVIDGAGLALWIVAVIAWWRHTEVVRDQYAPGGDMTSTDLAVTLLLAAAPGLLAVLGIALEFIP